MRDLLARIADQNEASRAARKQAVVPKVGIFFVVGKQLWIDGTPVTKAQAFAGMKTHELGHDVFWERLQARNAVSRDVEYDETPRGRVCCSVPERTFYLFVDPCVKRDANMIDRIIDELNLPSATKVELDSHYRCPGCMFHPEE
jgi:hypothetical protein